MNTLISNKLSRVGITTLISLMLFVTGCQKDDNTSNTLDGTTWTGTTTYSGYQVTVTISFIQNDFTYTMNVPTVVNGTVSFTGTYTYKYPTVECQVTTPGNSNVLTGTVSGNQMTCNDSGLIYILTKQ